MTMLKLTILSLSCFVTVTISLKCNSGTMDSSLAASNFTELDCSKDVLYQDKCHVTYHKKSDDKGSFTFGCVGAFNNLLCPSVNATGMKTDACCCDTETCNTKSFAQECGLMTKSGEVTKFNVMNSFMTIMVIGVVLLIQ